MAVNSFEVDQPLPRSSNRISQAFPGFKIMTFTYIISMIQIIYYIISVIIDGGFINPTTCSIFTLGANV